MLVEIESEERIITKETDRRGRITLGKDYADKKVRIAVIETVED